MVVELNKTAIINNKGIGLRYPTLLPQTERDPERTVTVMAQEQLSRTPSAELCVKMAAGGDPVFPFNVKLTGESVQGTSGSFR